MGIINVIRHYRPSIRMATLLATLGPLIIAIGVTVLTVKYYETDLLIKRTESIITDEAVFIAGLYKDTLQEMVRRRKVDQGVVAPTLTGKQRGLPEGETYGKAIDVVWHEDDTYWHFEPPILSIENLESQPAPPKTGVEPDAIAREVGRKLKKTIHRIQGTNVSQIDLLDMNGVIVASTMREYGPGYSIGHREDVIEALNGKVTKRLRVNKIEHNHVSLVCVWENLKTFFLGDRSGNHFDPEHCRPLRIPPHRVHVIFPIAIDSTLFGAVAVSRTPRSVWELMHEGITPQAVLFGLLTFVVFILLCLMLAFKVSEPIRALTERARRSQGGIRGVFRGFLARPLTAELNELSESMTTMVNKLEDQAEALDKNAKQTQHFATHVVHEARNQLASSQGALDLIARDANAMTDEQRQDFVSAIKQNLDRLTELFDDLQEQAAGNVQDASTNIDKVLQNISANVNSNQALRLSHNTSVSVVNMGLSEIVFESLLNSLLDNARRCGATSIDISITTRRLDDSQEALKVEFKDDGPGVPESDRQRIFDKGFTTKTEEEGGGLGLFNVRSLLTIHGGSIDLLDTPSGATFAIEIPLKP